MLTWIKLALEPEKSVNIAEKLMKMLKRNWVEQHRSKALKNSNTYNDSKWKETP